MNSSALEVRDLGLEITTLIFTARRYASADILLPCVCPSVRHKPRNDRTNRAAFGKEVSFHLSYIVV